MRKTLAVAAAAALAACALTAAPAQAATITTAGTGWKLTTQLGVTSASPSQTYTVTYESDAVRRFYAPQIQRAVDQINASTDLTITIGGVEAMDPNKCGPEWHIQVMELRNPMGDGHPGWSQGMPCPNPAQGMSRGGVVAMNSTYRSGEWNIKPEALQNTAVHEMLHAAGLDHPNYDRNTNGTVEPYECVATSYGNRPVMCSPNGGYSTWNNVGRLTGYDINGLNALISNARAQGIE
ncbi:hypothetical protein [Streptomyces sp. Isolate_219]|uniref:hypothetical protein n=1 Tax=Streptomyces sp. Isolate_219 TaxID=2950110 RepID=UPI0021C6F8D4|nr:hypothetical protein [Streptomyces sp. Isolate_219]MCR8574692.1 hypothetical protein [Streptomyces sp. Isolate_219]